MWNSDLNWRFIFRVCGFGLIIESLFIFISAGVAAWFDESTLPIISAGLVSLAAGLLIAIPAGYQKNAVIGKRESFITVTFVWILFATFGALPFIFSGTITFFPDAFFESSSGITTTGATIITNIDSMPKGILFWRSLMQWLGGLGIVVFSLAVFPLIGGEAAHLFDAESSGLTHDKFRPRVTQMAKRLWIFYLILTGSLTALLFAGNMSLFDAICHALTTISTGGFSTHQQSISFYNSIFIESVIIVFMTLGAVNFSLYYFLFKGRFKTFFKDEELRWFLGIIISGGLLVGVSLYFNQNAETNLNPFRNAFFQVISTFTTSGFSTGNFVQWGQVYWIIFIFFMVICGCAGSTSGGLKTVRAVVMAKNTFGQFRQLIHPRAIIPVRLNGKALSFETVQRLMAFSFLYIVVIFVSWLILTISGMPLVEALGAAVSCLGNVGPAIGTHGPSSTFVTAPTFAKWYLSFLMIVGRVEIFTALILFSPTFWKK
ncbi:MAG: TrkH family potassium uptake protein [Dysgonamonadaceae bacterium]|jgi:trk system potassium uptake protein TrkH|nr:TrkH family potassium uptake protein [Dysgonamonadaceae bacterium]